MPLRSFYLLIFFLPTLSLSAELQIEPNRERLERGQYLLTAVLGCSGCHSQRQTNGYGFAPIKELELAGGFWFRRVSDQLWSPNITPYALASWTDQQLLDVITTGVRPDGRVLHDVMPYKLYGTMDTEEIYAVIAYLRSLAPVESGPYPFDKGLTFPAHTAVPGALPRPSAEAPAADRGKYLVSIAGCNGCHAGGEKLPVASIPFAGGREFPIPGVGLIRAANLTPDEVTGLGAWTEAAFLARFAGMKGSENIPVADGQPNTVMHWWSYPYMSDTDLKAIYAYLRTLPAATNEVVRIAPMPGERVSPNWRDRR